MKRITRAWHDEMVASEVIRPHAWVAFGAAAVCLIASGMFTRRTRSRLDAFD